MTGLIAGQGGDAMRRGRALSLAALCLGVPVLNACSNSPSRSPATTGVTIQASDTACLVGTVSFPSGNQTFEVSNAGSQVNEVIIYGAGERVVGEVSNIGPSAGKRLTVALKPGRYSITCKPGLVGKGIRTPIVVKADSGAAPTTSPELDAALASYRGDVVAHAMELLARTRPFAAAVQAGDVTKARALYSAARVSYEAIAPIAQASGDLDARIDARIDDIENGQEWIGFHRLEHDLWLPPRTESGRSVEADPSIDTADISKDGPVATMLLADVSSLVGQVQRVELTADQVSTAARTLLDDVAGRGLTGAQERYSRLDLVDVAANVTGAEQAYEALRPIVLAKNPDLVTKLDQRFLAAQEALSIYGSGADFPVYDALSKADIHTLTSAIDAVIGPMGDVTTTLRKSD